MNQCKYYQEGIRCPNRKDNDNYCYCSEHKLCVRRRKPECTPPQCKWVKGKGCKPVTKKRSRSRYRRRRGSPSSSSSRSPSPVSVDEAIKADVLRRLEQIIPLSESKLEKLIEEYGESFKRFLDGYTITDPLDTPDGAIGSGAVGKAFALETYEQAPRILKLSLITDEYEKEQFDNEIKANKYLSKNKIAISPHMYTYGIYRHGPTMIGVMTTDKIDMLLVPFLNTVSVDPNTMEELLYLGFKWLFDHMCHYNLKHQDMNVGNIGVVFVERNSLRFQLIDWGHGAINEKCNPCLEISWLMGSLQGVYNDQEIRKTSMRVAVEALRKLWYHYHCQLVENNIDFLDRDATAWKDLYYDIRDY